MFKLHIACDSVHLLIKFVFVSVLCAGGADDNLIEGGETKFLCKPGARNITVIFQPLLRSAFRTIPLYVSSYIYTFVI